MEKYILFVKILMETKSVPQMEAHQTANVILKQVENNKGRPHLQ